MGDLGGRKEGEGRWVIKNFRNQAFSGNVVFTFNPVLLLLEVNAWFTEVGMNTFIPWQETVGTVGGLALLSGGTALALRRFRRKDVLV